MSESELPDSTRRAAAGWPTITLIVEIATAGEVGFAFASEAVTAAVTAVAEATVVSARRLGLSSGPKA